MIIFDTFNWIFRSTTT